MFLCIWLSLKVEYTEHMFFVCVHASCVCAYVLMHVEARGRCQMSSSVSLPYSLRQHLSLNSQADSGWLSSEFQGSASLCCLTLIPRAGGNTGTASLSFYTDARDWGSGPHALLTEPPSLMEHIFFYLFRESNKTTQQSLPSHRTIRHSSLKSYLGVLFCSRGD